ncbi:GIY-YIG nuclease family protein [Pararhodobacter zhoushanensis]|uniref:GIY-YIG nuclease family protein n=1 Tax=Pararhodobacter zhoushanensis TaxID=2479545 RepID=UPI000F8DE39B|nr:GIY-YIG nuclease family protein [Pararhodobacter zhoushanensis]
MDFRHLLQGLDVPLTGIALCLHKPPTRRERDALALMIDSAPALFEAYQATHTRSPQATLQARRIMASFLMRSPGELVFVGLYRQNGWTERTADELENDPLLQQVDDLTGGHVRTTVDTTAGDQLGRACFDLVPMSELAELKGRLVVRDPGSRAYMRLAETTPLEILEIARSPDLSPPMPDWRDLTLHTPTLRILPTRWAEQLRQWRGIYLIVDETDGARYVGAAYGEENLLGRWRAHVAHEIGVTAKLSRRNPASFRFSILDLLSPAATIDEVTRAEQQWMVRLHSRQYGLNA